MDPTIIALCALCLLVGGGVKGLAALGLPLVSMPLLTLVVSVPTAVGLLVAPMFFSNFLQSFQGGLFLPMLRRFWSFALTLFFASIIGTRLLVSLPPRTLNLVIGVLLIAVPIFLHFRPESRITLEQQRWGNPLTGIVSGILGGMSTFYGPPIMIYMMGLRLPKDEFVAGISFLYWVGALGLFIGIYTAGAASLPLLGLSILMLIPVAVGMWLGRRVQIGITERGFQRLLAAIYLLTGASFLVRAF